MYDSKIKCISWSPYGNFIGAGSDEGTLYLLSDQLSTALAPIKHRRDAISVVKFSPNNRYIAVGSHEGFIDIYDAENDIGFFQRCLCCKVSIRQVERECFSNFM